MVCAGMQNGIWNLKHHYRVFSYYFWMDKLSEANDVVELELELELEGESVAAKDKLLLLVELAVLPVLLW